jgi:hypothetical protein
LSPKELTGGDPLVKTCRPAEHAMTKVEDKPPAAIELGGRKDGTEPTRFGDWEKQGRCIDF